MISSLCIASFGRLVAYFLTYLMNFDLIPLDL